jgi:CubicO group peptidase (beta-lactamase class C family)
VAPWFSSRATSQNIPYAAILIPMHRRNFLQRAFGASLAMASPLIAAQQSSAVLNNDLWQKLQPAEQILAKSTADGQIHAASLYVRHKSAELAKTFGAAKSPDDIFLLASISKPISVAAVMTLYDQGKFDLDDPVKKFIPEFTGDGRERITIRQLLTHVSGLPDQLPENQSLRKRHAALSEFVQGAIRTPLLFEPGSRYRYSSMAILLAAEIAQRITKKEFSAFVDETVFQPLNMTRSALGLGRFKLEETIRAQVENAAPESGAGDPSAKDWDWNSTFWRNLGAPWGGAHGSAPDVARFLAEFLHPSGKALKPDTARLIVRNHNREGLTPRGLGFAIGAGAGGKGCSDQTFGHTGSTGTLCWADPATDTICVVLTTLPWQAANPHPAKLASDRVVAAVSGKPGD